MTSPASYSAFFSSGLLAAPLHIATSPLNSPILAENIEQLSGVSFPTTAKLVVPPRTPRLRRRRSSITTGMCSLSAIKSPTKSAGNAFLFDRIQSDIGVLGGGGGRDRSGSLGQIDINVDQRGGGRRSVFCFAPFLPILIYCLLQPSTSTFSNILCAEFCPS